MMRPWWSGRPGGICEATDGISRRAGGSNRAARGERRRKRQKAEISAVANTVRIGIEKNRAQDSALLGVVKIENAAFKAFR